MALDARNLKIRNWAMKKLWLFSFFLGGSLYYPVKWELYGIRIHTLIKESQNTYTHLRIPKKTTRISMESKRVFFWWLKWILSQDLAMEKPSTLIQLPRSDRYDWRRPPNMCFQLMTEAEVPSLKLTNRTWKWMVGRRSFPFGMASWQVLC